MREKCMDAAVASSRHEVDTDGSVTVLLVENDLVQAKAISDTVISARDGQFRLETLRHPREALERLAGGGVDVVLVGAGLPDGEDTDAFSRIRQATPDALVLPLDAPGRDAGVGDHSAGTAAWLLGVLRHVSRHKKAEETLFEEKERVRVTLSSIGDAVLVTDVQGHVTYLNPTAESLTGWYCADAVGRPLSAVFNIVDGETREPAVDPARRAIQEDRTVGLEANCVLLRPDGSESGIEDSAAPVHDRHGQVAGAVIVFRDVSRSRAITEKMAYLAQHDYLTGLCNRALLQERLSQAIHLARRHRKQAAVLFVDLNDFKQINDSHGHVVGDHVLQAVATFLKSCVRSSDTVCRQGGDEFVILLAELEHPEDAFQVADKLLKGMPSPLFVDGHALRVSMSIGISVFPDDGDDVEALLRHADADMYNAKTRAVPGVDAAGQRVARGRTHAQDSAWGQLRRALQDDEFVLHYQPQVDLSSGRIAGFEALVRWQRPSYGLVYPRQLMPLAHQAGLMLRLGRWVQSEVCRQINVWQEAGLVRLPVAVNVSAAEFKHPHFVAGIIHMVREAAIDADRLELEVDDRVLMRDVEGSAKTLKTLKEAGFRLAIDGFGLGYTSQRDLRRFPIDTIKVNRALMPHARVPAERTVILRTIIALGKSLGCRVVGEGVQTPPQLEFLRAHECDAAQGYQIGYPLAAEEAGPLLAMKQPVPLAKSC